jgi:hypothetical protein
VVPWAIDSDDAELRARVAVVLPATRPIARVRGDVAVLAHAVAAGIPAEPPYTTVELDGSVAERARADLVRHARR